MNITNAFPTYQVFEQAGVASVAGVMLKLVFAKSRNGEQAFHVRNEISDVAGMYGGRWESARVASEAIAWMFSRGLVCQSPGADIGWYILTREGIRAAGVSDFAKWSADRELPEALLHPAIASECITSFRAGKYDTAVFEAFKALEVAMREGSGCGHDLLGVKLAARAFHPEDGPLTDMLAEGGERTALMNLMTGAMGYFKNPQSHRKVDLSGWEAREMLVFASHLYRIVETRSLAPN